MRLPPSPSHVLNFGRVSFPLPPPWQDNARRPCASATSILHLWKRSRCLPGGLPQRQHPHGDAALHAHHATGKLVLAGKRKNTMSRRLERAPWQLPLYLLFGLRSVLCCILLMVPSGTWRITTTWCSSQCATRGTSPPPCLLWACFIAPSAGKNTVQTVLGDAAHYPGPLSDGAPLVFVLSVQCGSLQAEEDASNGNGTSEAQRERARVRRWNFMRMVAYSSLLSLFYHLNQGSDVCCYSVWMTVNRKQLMCVLLEGPPELCCSDQISMDRIFKLNTPQELNLLRTIFNWCNISGWNQEEGVETHSENL